MGSPFHFLMNLRLLLIVLSFLSRGASGNDHDPVNVPGAQTFLAKYPKSDTNSDGILTVLEKQSYSKELAIEKLGGNHTYEQVLIPMRDGVKLATGIFRPRNGGGGKHSTVLCRTAYGIWSAALFDTEKFANKNLVYICQDLRGDGESEGAGTVDLKSFDNEIDDGYDTIDWISQQPWSNQKVAIVGQSGHGFSAYMAYLAKHPNLIAADTNISGGNAHLYWTYHNGVKREMYYRWLAQRGVSIPLWPRPGIENFDRSAYDRIVKEAAVDNGTVFIAKTGWYDIFSESALDYFEAFAEKGNVFVQVDASGHGRMEGKPFPARRVHGEWALPVVTKVLEDPALATKQTSRLVYYLMGDGTDPQAPGNCYKMTEVWPVPHDPTPYFLHADGTVKETKPTASGETLTFQYDPCDPVLSVGGDVFIHDGVGPRDQRILRDRTDILRFVSLPLDKPLEITGKITAKLFVSSDVADTTFTVKFLDIYPDGHEAVVRDSIIMGRFHSGFYKQLPLTPGEVYELNLDMWSTALVVNQGHRLGVHISSSNSPKYEVHPNTFEPVNSYENSPVASNTIHLSAKHPSHILLPVVVPSP